MDEVVFVTEVSKPPITPAIATGLSLQVITVMFVFKSYSFPSKHMRLSLSFAFLTEKSSAETSFPIKFDNLSLSNACKGWPCSKRM